MDKTSLLNTADKQLPALRYAVEATNILLNTSLLYDYSDCIDLLLKFNVRDMRTYSDAKG